MYCEECGRPYPEKHHIIFRSQSRLAYNFHLNEKWLCGSCHRGNKGPHKNRARDLKYKREYQKKLHEIVIKDYYSLEGLQKALKMTKSQINRLAKYLKVYPEGYERDEIILLLCGGRNYI